MAIPLATLIAYAFSAKVKGDRIRKKQDEDRKAEIQKTRMENQMGTLYKLPGGRMLPVADGSPMQLPEGAKAVKYGKMSGLTYDFPQEEAASIFKPYYKQGDSFGLIDKFTPDQQLQPDFRQVGTQKIDPDGQPVDSPAFFPGFDYTKDGSEQATKNATQWWQLQNPVTKQAESGTPNDVLAWAEKNDVDLTKDWIGTRHIRTTEGSNVTLSAGNELNFNKKDDNSDLYVDDVRVTLKNGDAFFLSQREEYIAENGAYDPLDIVQRTPGKRQINGTDFRPSSTQVDRPSASEGGTDDDLEKALTQAELAEMELYFPYGEEGSNTYIGIKAGKNTAGTKLRSFATQMANASEAIREMKQNPQSPLVTTLANNIYNLALGEYTQTIPVGQDAVFAVNRQNYPTFKSYIQDMGTQLMEIPGLAERVTAWDEGKTAETRMAVEQTATESTDVRSVVIDQTPPPEVTGDVPTRTVSAVTFPRAYSETVDSVILPLVEPKVDTGTGAFKTQSRKESALLAIANDFVRYETQPDGRTLLRNQNGDKIPRTDQPILQMFQTYQQNNQMPFFMQMVDVNQAGRPTAGQEYVDIATRFATATDGKVEVAAGIIQHIMPSSAGTQSALQRMYGFDTVGQKTKFFDGQRDVMAASTRGLGVVRSSIATYYTPGMPQTPENLLDNTALSNFKLFGQGMQYYLGEAADLFGIDVTNFSDMYRVVAGGRQRLRSRREYWDDSRRDEGDAIFREEIESIQNRVASGEISKQYAQREFYTLVLAYEVAAAIQGGTGGRTISDQDVALIFRGLRQRWSDSPQTQVNALRAVESLLTRFRSRAQAMTGTNEQRAAWLVAEDLILKGGGNPDSIYDIDYVLAELDSGYEAQSSRSQPTDDPDYEKGLLEYINRNRKARGQASFGTIEEAKEETNFADTEAKYKIIWQAKRDEATGQDS